MTTTAIPRSLPISPRGGEVYQWTALSASTRAFFRDCHVLQTTLFDPDCGSSLDSSMEVPDCDSSNTHSTSSRESWTPLDKDGPKRTSVMIRHIACRYTESDVRRILDEAGFAGTYDSIHVPIKHQNPSNLGYAFVNFISHDYVAACTRRFSGRKFGDSATKKLCEVALADVQGTTGKSKRSG